MWSMDVYSKAWLLLWNTGSSLSLREEDSSLRSVSTRWRQLLHVMGSISHRFTMPTQGVWALLFLKRLANEAKWALLTDRGFLETPYFTQLTSTELAICDVDEQF